MVVAKRISRRLSRPVEFAGNAAEGIAGRLTLQHQRQHLLFADVRVERLAVAIDAKATGLGSARSTRVRFAWRAACVSGDRRRYIRTLGVPEPIRFDQPGPS